MTARVTLPLAWVTEALDEIYALRAVCAYEAGVRKADLSYATYPKSRRAVAEHRVEALTLAAQGRAAEVVDSRPKIALRAAGAKETLTRASWEAEKSLPRICPHNDCGCDGEAHP